MAFFFKVLAIFIISGTNTCNKILFPYIYKDAKTRPNVALNLIIIQLFVKQFPAFVKRNNSGLEYQLRFMHEPASQTDQFAADAAIETSSFSAILIP